MNRIHEGLEYKDFTMPASVEQKTVCQYTGYLAVAGRCPSITEYFAVGSVPNTACPGHGGIIDEYGMDIGEQERLAEEAAAAEAAAAEEEANEEENPGETGEEGTAPTDPVIPDPTDPFAPAEPTNPEPTNPEPTNPEPAEPTNPEPTPEGGPPPEG